MERIDLGLHPGWRRVVRERPLHGPREHRIPLPSHPHPVPATNALSSTLYRGTNQRGITSFTWFPPQNTTTFDTDFYPLVKFLIDNQLIEPTVQLGLVAFGQEAFFSTGNVTFAAEGYNINITRPDGESATVGSDNPSGKGAAGGLRPASFGALVGVVAVLCAFL